MALTERCRHRKTWIICGGWMEWCYECGALRQLERITGTNISKPEGKWIKPVGKGGDNPTDIVRHTGKYTQTV